MVEHLNFQEIKSLSIVAILWQLLPHFHLQNQTIPCFHFITPIQQCWHQRNIPRMHVVHLHAFISFSGLRPSVDHQPTWKSQDSPQKRTQNNKWKSNNKKGKESFKILKCITSSFFQHIGDSWFGSLCCSYCDCNAFTSLHWLIPHCSKHHTCLFCTIQFYATDNRTFVFLLNNGIGLVQIEFYYPSLPPIIPTTKSSLCWCWWSKPCL